MFTQGGWIPVREQYPHASLGFVKVFTSSLCAFREKNNTASISTRRWQSCIHRLKCVRQWVWHKSVFLWGFPLQMTVGRETNTNSHTTWGPRVQTVLRTFYCISPSSSAPVFNLIWFLIKWFRSCIWSAGDHDVDWKLQASWTSSQVSGTNSYL